MTNPGYNCSRKRKNDLINQDDKNLTNGTLLNKTLEN
jgi:hypothetical protein